MKIRRWLERGRDLVPLFDQLRGYDRVSARRDVLAAMTVTALLVPQSMAYAMLAGLPPRMGLYASTIPLLIYALVGSSRYLSVGPVALVSVVVAATLSDLAEPGSAEYVGYALTLGLLIGGVQLLAGTLRLGAFVDLLSRPVIVGFTAGAAILIAVHQLPSLVGLEVVADDWTLVPELLTRIGEVSLPTLGLGIGCVAGLVLLRWRYPRLPRSLVVVGLSALLVFLLDPGGVHVAIVGEIPAGLPNATLPELSLSSAESLLAGALVATLVGFVEAYSVATVTAAEDGEEVDGNRELLGLGIGNVASSLVGGAPVGGAFSRTAVNVRAGARTGLSVVLAGVFVILTVLFFTPALRTLPMAALSAIVIVAVSGLVDTEAMRELWRLDKREFGLMAVTGIATLIFGVGPGVAAGVSLSLAIFIRRKARPKVLVLGHVPGTQLQRELGRHPDAEPIEGICLLKPLGPMFFANSRALRDGLLEELEERADAVVLALDVSACPFVDSTGARMLAELLERLEERKIELHLVDPHGGLVRTLERAGLMAALGDGRVHLSSHEVVRRALPESHGRWRLRWREQRTAAAEPAGV